MSLEDRGRIWVEPKQGTPENIRSLGYMGTDAYRRVLETLGAEHMIDAPTREFNLESLRQAHDIVREFFSHSLLATRRREIFEQDIDRLSLPSNLRARIDEEGFLYETWLTLRRQYPLTPLAQNLSFQGHGITDSHRLLFMRPQFMDRVFAREGVGISVGIEYQTPQGAIKNIEPIELMLKDEVRRSIETRMAHVPSDTIVQSLISPSYLYHEAIIDQIPTERKIQYGSRA